jgi:hypothetical protein
MGNTECCGTRKGPGNANTTKSTTYSKQIGDICLCVKDGQIAKIQAKDVTDFIKKKGPFQLEYDAEGTLSRETMHTIYDYLDEYVYATLHNMWKHSIETRRANLSNFQVYAETYKEEVNVTKETRDEALGEMLRLYNISFQDYIRSSKKYPKSAQDNGDLLASIIWKYYALDKSHTPRFRSPKDIQTCLLEQITLADKYKLDVGTLKTYYSKDNLGCKPEDVVYMWLADSAGKQTNIPYEDFILSSYDPDVASTKEVQGAQAYLKNLVSPEKETRKEDDE